MDELTIGRFARLCRLSVKQLRHYDELGLLPPARVDAFTGYRYYTRAQARDALTIALLREADVPLPGIRAVLDAPDPTVALTAERDRLAARIERDRERLAVLTRLASGAAYEITLVDEPELTLAYESGTTTVDDLGATIGRLIGTLLGRTHAWRPPMWGLFPLDITDGMTVTAAAAVAGAAGDAGGNVGGAAGGNAEGESASGLWMVQGETGQREREGEPGSGIRTVPKEAEPGSGTWSHRLGAESGSVFGLRAGAWSSASGVEPDSDSASGAETGPRTHTVPFSSAKAHAVSEQVPGQGAGQGQEQGQGFGAQSGGSVRAVHGARGELDSASGAPLARADGDSDSLFGVGVGPGADPGAEADSPSFPPRGAVSDPAPLTLPATRAAVTLHHGPYAQLSLAYYAVLSWIHDNGLRPVGPARESYLVAPGEAAPEDLITRVVIPVVPVDSTEGAEPAEAPGRT